MSTFTHANCVLDKQMHRARAAFPPEDAASFVLNNGNVDEFTCVYCCHAETTGAPRNAAANVMRFLNVVSTELNTDKIPDRFRAIA